MVVKMVVILQQKNAKHGGSSLGWKDHLNTLRARDGLLTS